MPGKFVCTGFRIAIRLCLCTLQFSNSNQQQPTAQRTAHPASSLHSSPAVCFDALMLCFCLRAGARLRSHSFVLSLRMRSTWLFFFATELQGGLINGLTICRSKQQQTNPRDVVTASSLYELYPLHLRPVPPDAFVLRPAGLKNIFSFILTCSRTIGSQRKTIAVYIVPYDPSVLTSADVRSQRGSNVMQELPSAKKGPACSWLAHDCIKYWSFKGSLKMRLLLYLWRFNVDWPQFILTSGVEKPKRNKIILENM